MYVLKDAHNKVIRGTSYDKDTVSYHSFNYEGIEIDTSMPASMSVCKKRCVGKRPELPQLEEIVVSPSHRVTAVMLQSCAAAYASRLATLSF